MSTDRPLAGVLVSATARSAVHNATVEVATDAAGRFQMTGLHAGEYELTALAPAWAAERTTATLGVAETSEGVRLRARPATVVSAVIRAGGKACAGGQLALHERAASADVEGKLTIAGVVPRTYAARASCPGSVAWSGEHQVGTTPVLREWELETGAVVSGRVERANGAPFPGAHVGIVPRRVNDKEPPSPLMECVSDEAGAFECSGVAPGEYTIWIASDPVSPPASITISSGAINPGPIVLRARPAATILAHVGPARSTQVGAFNVLARRALEFPVIAVVEPDGHARFDLPLGEYTVYLGPTSDVPPDARRVVLSADGQRVEVELPRPSLLSISGVAVDAAGMPVPDVWVHAESTAWDAMGAPLGVPTLTNERGEFTVQELIPGSYRIMADRSRSERTRDAVQAGAEDVVLRLAD